MLKPCKFLLNELVGISAGGNLAAAVAMRWRRLLQDSSAQLSGLYPIKLQFLMFPFLQAFNFSTNSYLLFQHNGLNKLTTSGYVVSYLFGLTGQAHDNLTMELYRNSHTTTTSRASFASIFAMDNETDKKEAAMAAKIRMDPKEFDPVGKSELEGKLLPLVTNDEFSPLLAEDFRGVPATYLITGGMDVLRDDGAFFARRLRQSGQVSVVQYRNYAQCDHHSWTSHIDLIESDWIQFLDSNPVW